MSAYAIAKSTLAQALEQASQKNIAAGDLLHALLVSTVDAYKTERGGPDTKAALEFQINNLADDLDYEFMRP
jgi:hypothetical protein